MNPTPDFLLVRFSCTAQKLSFNMYAKTISGVAPLLVIPAKFNRLIRAYGFGRELSHYEIMWNENSNPDNTSVFTAPDTEVTMFVVGKLARIEWKKMQHEGQSYETGRKYNSQINVVVRAVNRGDGY